MISLYLEPLMAASAAFMFVSSVVHQVVGFARNPTLSYRHLKSSGITFLLRNASTSARVRSALA